MTQSHRKPRPSFSASVSPRHRLPTTNHKLPRPPPIPDERDDQFDATSTDSDQDHNSSHLQTSADSPPPYAPHYFNVAPLPIFHGGSDECPDSHITRFTKVCRANNASSAAAMARIFPVTLQGEASLWHDLNVEPYYPSLSWEDTKSSFLEAYRWPAGEIADQLRSDLAALRQGEEERVRSYFLRLQWIVKRWPEGEKGRLLLSDDSVRRVFVDGLRGEIREGTVGRQPASLEKALGVAIGFERRRKGGDWGTGVADGDVAEGCGFCGGPHEEMGGCRVREMMKEAWKGMNCGSNGGQDVGFVDSAEEFVTGREEVAVGEEEEIGRRTR